MRAIPFLTLLHCAAFCKPWSTGYREALNIAEEDVSRDGTYPVKFLKTLA